MKSLARQPSAVGRILGPGPSMSFPWLICLKLLPHSHCWERLDLFLHSLGLAVETWLLSLMNKAWAWPLSRAVSGSTSENSWWLSVLLLPSGLWTAEMNLPIFYFAFWAAAEIWAGGNDNQTGDGACQLLIIVHIWWIIFVTTRV